MDGTELALRRRIYALEEAVATLTGDIEHLKEQIQQVFMIAGSMTQSHMAAVQPSPSPT